MADKNIVIFDPDTKNDDIFNRLRYEATDDFRRNIPKATQASLKEQLKQLNNYAPGWNEFIAALVNKIGLTIQKSNNWTNPLAVFKRGMLEHGEGIEEINVGLTQAYVFDEHALYGEEMLFGREYPDVQADYHKINRKSIYKITVDQNSLKRAFLSETGLAEFINQLMAVPTITDNRDEYLLMRQLFAEYEENGGFFKVNIPVIPTNADAQVPARQALRAIKAMRGKLQFLSNRYNAARMDVSAQGKELHLFATPEFMAAVDVEALAGLFNVSYGEIEEHVTLIDDFNMEDTLIQAILTTSDFFVVADTTYETRNQPNAAGLHENFFLHHHQIISASRFVPAIAFTNGPGTEVTEEDVTLANVTAIAGTNVFTDEAITDAVERGEGYQLTATFAKTPADIENYGVVWRLSGATAPKTRIDQLGHLTVSETEAAEEIVVSAYTAGLDEEDAFSLTLTVEGDQAVIWPNPGVVDYVPPVGGE